MAKLVWDTTGAKFAETGIKNGVLYPLSGGVYGAGVAWNGLTSVGEAPTGAEVTPFYADNQKYLEITSAEEFAGTIGCYTYPDVFKACVGEADLSAGVSIGQQTHTKFGFAYRTEIVNDIDGLEYGYKLHLVYNSIAGISARDHTTINDSPAFEELSFDFTATKVPVTNAKPSAHLVVDSSKVNGTTLATFEDILFGTVGLAPRLPLPDEIATLFATGAPSAIALSTIVPADDAANIAVTANIVLTFNNQIASEAVVVTSNAGVLVAGAKTWDVTGKILTFDPTASLTNSASYIVTVGGVVDIYGQALTAVVKNFTVVAL